ncbi:MAG: hypothetical protein NC122_07095 [Faecalibacterium sp.]|nr:hypothetical protein [Ruminococcus sp.]MCM1392255.1 hypothetical protein [Ruminococcus sp.]MCM1485957.1 hypothetical protein [Faecalibacterium sp.]
MKVTYNQILSAREALGKLSDKPLPMKEAVSLARMIKKLNGELEVFNEKQKELFEKYGKPDEIGGYMIEEENQLEFSSHFEQLLSVEFEIDAERVHVQSNIDIEASVVLATEAFVEFETE